jgi:DNA (cytosine-5)-methyltransferase 1
MLNVLDLFAGIGGFSLGLERTGGFKTVAFCEVDKKAQAVLNKHWPHVPIYDDVTKLKGKDLNETIDIITGGFPCQDISLAGKGAGLEGARSGLWWEFHRLIKEIQPKWVIAENVSALRSRGLDQVLSSLSEIGYDAEWHCIPASAVGAPHRRDRIWIVAYPRHGGRGDIWAVKEGDNPSIERTANSNPIGGPSKQSTLMAYPNIIGAQVQASGEHASQQVLRGSSEAWRAPVGDFWSVEPSVGRVAHGVSGRVDRLKQLGNAVVPQIPELIGRAILNLTN